MASPLEFLLVDEEPEYRLLLLRSLLHQFVGATVRQCEGSEQAVSAARSASLSAVVARRASDADSLPLLELLRGARPWVPILCVSLAANRDAAFKAGATAFLHQDAWARAGAAVEDMLRTAVLPPNGPKAAGPCR